MFRFIGNNHREYRFGSLILMTSQSIPPRSVQRDGPFRPAKATPVETPYRHALHAYQGLCPWSPSGDSLLYAGFSDDSGNMQIVVRNLSAGQDTVVGEASPCDYHTAAYQQWILGGKGIVFRNGSAERGGSVVVSAPGHNLPNTLYPSLRVRAVSADTHRGYGYTQETPAASMRVDFESGQVEKHFTTEEIAAHLPEELQADCAYSFSHFVPNHDETKAFIKLSKPEPHRKIPGQMDDWGAFFVYDLRDRSFRCLGQRISGHPQWMPDGRRIVNIMQPQDGSNNRWIVAQDTDTGEVERLVDFPIEGPGHPVISPCGRYLATDAYPANGMVCPIYLIELATGRMSEIARFPHATRTSNTYQPGVIHRANLHPVWSPDGTQLLINTNDLGTRLGMVLLEGFLTGVA